MATVRRRCPACGAETDAGVFEGVGRDGRRRWMTLIICHGCGARTQERGRDALPADLRRALLDDDPAWELRIDEAPASPASAAALGSVLGWSEDDVRVLREALPGPVATGTWAEIEALRARLTALGVGASKGWAGEPLAYLRWSRS